jgi:hypothetical protein
MPDAGQALATTAAAAGLALVLAALFLRLM